MDALEHDPEKWVPVFSRDKREAFARRSCSNKKIERDDDSKKSLPALVVRRRTRKDDDAVRRKHNGGARGKPTQRLAPGTTPARHCRPARHLENCRTRRC